MLLCLVFKKKRLIKIKNRQLFLLFLGSSHQMGMQVQIYTFIVMAHMKSEPRTLVILCILFSFYCFIVLTRFGPNDQPPEHVARPSFSMNMMYAFHQVHHKTVGYCSCRLMCQEQ